MDEAEKRRIRQQQLSQKESQSNLAKALKALQEGVSFHRSGRLDEAIGCYQKAIAIKPDYVAAHSNLGAALQVQGKLDEAVACYKKAIAIKPDFADAHSNLGNALQLQGKLDEAVACYEKAIAIKPDFADAHSNLGNVLQLQGKLNEAVESCKSALAIKPDFVDAHYNLGAALQLQGKLDEAVACYEKALAIKPNYIAVLSNLGNALKAQDKLDEAVACYEKALAIKPDFADAHSNLGNALKVQGKLDEAVASYKKAIAIKPDLADAHSNLGAALQVQDKLDEAVVCYEKAIAIKPDFADAHSNLGNALQAQDKLDEAVVCYKKAIAIKPDFADAHCKLGNALQAQGKLDEAIACYEKALAIKPYFADAHSDLGAVLQTQDRLDEAVACYEKALAIQPDLADAHYNLGTALQVQGELDEAVACYEKALAIKPELVDAHVGLSMIKKYADISEIQDMENLLSNETNDEGKIGLNFALGKAMSDMKQDSEAFQYFLEGNRLKRTTIEFNIIDEEKRFSLFRETFNEDFFNERKGFGYQDKTPIFILGMPRSGSTLIEQILSSHPEVFGAGEMPFIDNILHQKFSSLNNAISHTVSQLKLDDSIQLGKEYLAKVREIEPDTKFITNKMPHNFLHVGIIKLILPNAKIIHSVRSPEDTCLSIFKAKFVGFHNYSYNLTELGQYYRLYSEMMAHWHRVLPGTIYDLNYETLTANQKDETRKLLKFCGLEWDDNCLNFHKNIRDVQTASSVQVRQPMYRSSVGGWRRFEKQLQPLITALGNLSSCSSEEASFSRGNYEK